MSVLLLTLLLAAGAAQRSGAIEGSVARQDGARLAGVMVVLRESGAVEWTSTEGRYRFAAVRPGTYTIVLSLGGYSATETVTVTADTPVARVETTVDWPLTFVEAMVVTAASKRVESIAEAPAAITALDAREIARQSTSGQLPLLLAAGAGIQVAQSGLYDFNVNARGFNGFLNRRVRTEIDGREASLPHVMGYTDWATLPMAIDEFEQVEFVRGPGGALYGVGALNGILSLRSRAPASSLGGKARIVFGELGTARVEFRHAGQLGRDWFFKATGAYQRSDDFAVSRVTGGEYPGLAREVVELPRDRARLASAGGRLDRHFDGGATLVLEGGTTHKDGQVTVTTLGRFQATGSRFPWARAAFTTPRCHVLAAITTADIDDQVGLASGAGTFQSGSNLQLEARRNGALGTGRGRWLLGTSYGRQRVDSADARGVQTIFEQPESADSGAVFGQLEYELTRRLKASFAARLDAMTIARTTFSPRAAVVYEMAPGQRVRVAVSQAFKAPTLAELRLRAAIAPPIDLSPLEAALAPILGGTSLGWRDVPLLAVGNEHLDVEEIRSVEIGYSSVVFASTFVQAAYYRNKNQTFTSNLLPQVGTTFGRLNPSFGPYQPPASLSAGAAATVRGALAAALPPSLLATLSNRPDGRPVFAVLSLANFGVAATQGIEVSSVTMPDDHWRVHASYAWFDFNLDSDAPEAPLRPNTPSHQAAGGITYVSSAFDAGLRLRWVDEFRWVSGIYAGRVPAYTVVDLQANVPLADRLTLGIDVANLLDHVHYEMFGGDLLRRRALAYVTVNW